MNEAYFITGTDTGVGKTYIAVRLLEHLSATLSPLAYIKPFQTGCDTGCGGGLFSPDAEYVKASLGEKVDVHVLHRYKLAACPLLAAEAEGERIDFAKAVERVKEISSKYQGVVVEGAGGLMVPITQDKTMLDFAAELDYPVIVVAANRIGCINHSILSTDAVLAKGLNISTLVLNSVENAPLNTTLKENARMIKTMDPSLRIIEVNYGGRFSL